MWTSVSPCLDPRALVIRDAEVDEAHVANEAADGARAPGAYTRSLLSSTLSRF